MARTRASYAANDSANGDMKSTPTTTAPHKGDQKTDLTRWRLLNDNGRQTWHYMKTEAEAKEWPQSVADKWYLGLDTEQPNLPPAHTAKEAATNGFTFFSKLQLEPGNWGCEYGGPMFLLPGFIILYYVTNTPILEEQRIEHVNYIFARQAKDGGWGLHIEGESSVFGISMNYIALRILGVDADDVRMVKARKLLHSYGGSVNGPHWLKWWMAVLGVVPWELVNPVPAELWLLPDWTPISPWRWWIHIRMVYLPMSFIASKKWSYPLTDLTRELRKELFVKPFDQINFLSHRNSIHERDNYHPKSWILNTINTIIVNVWDPYLRTNRIKKAAEEYTWKLIQLEDQNTDYSCLAPVNAPMQSLAVFIQEGGDSYGFKRHIERLEDFKWMKGEGMLVNGTNGVQNWDTAFAVQAAHEAGLATDDRFRPVLIKALQYLEGHQTLENCQGIADIGTNWRNGYRHPTTGAWGFSNRDQGYSVSDCISEAVKSIVTLQAIPSYPKLVSEERLHLAVDNILTYQNPDTYGCSSYELRRGSTLLEYLNAAEVFGRIMVEYDYPECTTACVIALATFRKHHPNYRSADIQKFIDRALIYIRKAQRPDGSWYGAWGICFTYAGMFALESLALVGETCETSERVRRACEFFLKHQQPDGGWGETYKSCETGVWCQHEQTQVVQTAWVVIALLHAEYPDVEPIRRAVKLLMERQQANGEWLQEGIEGVFNKSCMISYPNYKFEFPIKALGMFAQRYGDMKIL